MYERKINRKIIKILRSLSDEGTFHILCGKSGHQTLVGNYGGVRRKFTICSTPSSTYQKYMISTLRSFIRTLPIETDWKEYYLLNTHSLL